MKTIIITYPEFKLLPKGVRRMLVTSEQHFFDEAKGDSLKATGRLAQTRRSQAPMRSRSVKWSESWN